MKSKVSVIMVHPIGFEPTTPGSEDQCSNPAELRVHNITEVV